MKLPAHPVKTGQARLGLPGNEEYDYKVGFDSTAGVRYRLPRHPVKTGQARRGIQPTCP